MTPRSVVPRADNEGGIGENVTPKYWKDGFFHNLYVKELPWVDVNAYDSFADAIDGIGTTEKALVIASEESVTNDKTVPSNVTLKFLQGGSLSISTGKTVTINGHVEAGLYQIFEGSGTVSIGSVAIKIIPQWWGALTTASATTNNTALAASITALPDYGSWELPGGEYDISSVVTFSTKNDCTIDFMGRLKSASCSGVSFETVYRCDIRGVNVKLDSGYSWASGYYGVKVKDFDDNTLFIKRTHNFEQALYLDGDTGGVAYNNIHLGLLYNSKYGIYIRSINGGYVNENNYYGGNIRLFADTKAAESGGWGLYFVASPSHMFNNHRFYGTCFENLHNGIQFNSVRNTTLITPRFESVDANWVNGGAGVYSLIWMLGVEYFDESKVSFDNNTRGLLILGANLTDTNYRPIITDNKYGGISFASNRHFADVVSHLLVQSFNPAGLRYNDIFGTYQVFNKAYTGATAPTSGTYGDEAIAWNTNVASGQPMGWVCSQRGTTGTLSGVTGGITNGTKKLTVNDASNLLEGMFITIVGVSGIKGIEYINGDDVYIYVAADATVSGAAVAYSTPTWVAMPNYP